MVHLTGRGMDIIHLSGKRALDGAGALCLPRRIIVTNADPETPIAGPCTVLTPRTLRASGAVALWPHRRDGTRTSVRDVQGKRPWTGG